MTVHTCKVKASKLFPQATTIPNLSSKEELPKLAKTPDIVDDQQAKEPEPEGKTNEFIEELTHFSKVNDNIPLNPESKIKRTLNPLGCCHQHKGNQC